jgi:hypothetical protein
VIKLAEGFVEQHQLGVDGERARQRDALPHAAQELVDIFPLRALQADAREPCGRLATRLGRRDAEDEQTELRVLDRVAPGQQAVGLEADRELAAQHLERALRIAAGDPHLPAARRHRPHDQVQDGLLPTPVRPSSATISPGATRKVTPSTTT